MLWRYDITKEQERSSAGAI